MRHPWPSSRYPLPSNNSRRMLARGKPSGILTRWSLQLFFVRIFYLAYIIIILLASSKSMTTKMSEIKSEKYTIPYETSNTIDPAKHNPKRCPAAILFASSILKHHQQVSLPLPTFLIAIMHVPHPSIPRLAFPHSRTSRTSRIFLRFLVPGS